MIRARGMVSGVYADDRLRWLTIVAARRRRLPMPTLEEFEAASAAEQAADQAAEQAFEQTAE